MRQEDLHTGPGSAGRSLSRLSLLPRQRPDQQGIAEIKSTLRQDGIEQILEHLRVFPDFFPQHRGKELYGILAAIDAPPEVQEKALREGLYLVLVSEDAFRLIEREGFQPRDFSG